ncbi:MAG TPA: TlpA disulfide reductase family protein [Bacteroidales bacterium]|nr:TlpA disulfide reductase family protein [Bacteroidales bacterium]HPS17299.1 TlpA disulfide reductase family protein [Bacteroidales bacterium]
MKKNIFFIFVLFSLCVHGLSQNADSSIFSLPSIALKKLDGTNINTSQITNEGKPIIIIFWKSCCPPNIKLLDAIHEVYADWQEETGVVLYSVSIDDSRTSSKIVTLVNGKGWEFNVWLDVNSDFKRAMNVVATPHIFILNKNKNITWQKTTYSPGDEDEIYKILKTL